MKYGQIGRDQADSEVSQPDALSEADSELISLKSDGGIDIDDAECIQDSDIMSLDERDEQSTFANKESC